MKEERGLSWSGFQKPKECSAVKKNTCKVAYNKYSTTVKDAEMGFVRNVIEKTTKST